MDDSNRLTCPCAQRGAHLREPKTLLEGQKCRVKMEDDFVVRTKEEGDVEACWGLAHA